MDLEVFFSFHPPRKYPANCNFVLSVRLAARKDIDLLAMDESLVVSAIRIDRHEYLYIHIPLVNSCIHVYRSVCMCVCTDLRD